MINGKNVSEPLDKIFTKLQTTRVHNTRSDKLNVPICKTSAYDLQSFTTSSIKEWNGLNSKTNIDFASQD